MSSKQDRPSGGVGFSSVACGREASHDLSRYTYMLQAWIWKGEGVRLLLWNMEGLNCMQLFMMSDFRG